jgi:hypothetical protein
LTVRCRVWDGTTGDSDGLNPPIRTAAQVGMSRPQSDVPAAFPAPFEAKLAEVSVVPLDATTCAP